MRLKNLKGTQDYYGSEMTLRRRIEDVLRGTFIGYGFGEAIS